MLVNNFLSDFVSTMQSDLILKHFCYKYKLFTSREVRIGENCARGLEYGLIETEGTVFPNMDGPRPVNNIFIYF